MIRVHGDRQNEVVRALVAASKENPGKGQGDDKQVDGKQVGRKAPHGFLDMFFIGVFDNHDLELTGEKHDAPHRQKKSGCPIRIARFTHSCKGRQVVEQPGVLDCHPVEYVNKSVEEEVGYIDPHGQERKQLYDRLEGNGRNESLMAHLGGKGARAEKDAEGADENRKQQSGIIHDEGVPESRRNAERWVTADNGECGCNSFKLQGNVGDDSQNGNQGDECSQGL